MGTYTCFLLLAFVVLLGLFGLFVWGIIWLIEHLQGSNTRTAAVLPPRGVAVAELAAAPPDFVALDQLVLLWGSTGLLSPEVVVRVRALIAHEQTLAMMPPTMQVVPTPPVPAQPPQQIAAPTVPQPVAPVRPAVVPPVAAPPVPPVAAPVVPAIVPPVTPPVMPAVMPPVAPPVPPVAPRVARPALGAALLALGTRRTLLFLGTFLLLMSSLTLVIFNWTSLAPLVQFAILAGTTGALWAGGAWMTRQPDLKTAGRNLEAVAAMLMPVVGFALGRPGLLDLAPRPAWQLTSALSLGAYLLATWRTRRSFYSGAAALAAVSLLFAVLGTLAAEWQMVPVLALLAALLPIAARLRASTAPQLAEGPRWVALIGGPVILLSAAMLALSSPAGSYAFAAALVVGTIFGGLAYRFEGRVAWLWAAVALPPIAVQVALNAADSSLAFHAFALAICGLIYLGLVATLEDRHQPALAPLFTGSLSLGLLTLPLVGTDLTAARLALLPLMLSSTSIVLLVERGRLTWLGLWRANLATMNLAAAAGMLFGWLGALLFGWTDSASVSALWLLPLAAVYFAGAYWWPGRLRATYDQVLQVAGNLVVLLAGLTAVADEQTQLAGALLIALIFGGQAVARRIWPWAALSLTAGALAASFAVQRFIPFEQQLQVGTLVALGLAVGYSLAGERLRHTALRYWTRPAVVIALLNGLLASANALSQMGADPRLFTGVFVVLAALLGAHTALWRRGELGYPTALLLLGATLVAAREGFFTGWQPAFGDLGYVLSTLALSFALLGQGLRRYSRAYALPYEQVAFGVLPVAPLLAGTDPAHLTLTWSSLAGLYGLALWRYRLPWMLALAFVALDMGLLHGAAWLLPGGDPAGAGLLLAIAVVLQTSASIWLKGRPAAFSAAGRWGYLSAGLGGVGALVLAASSAGHTAMVAGLLAILVAVLVWVEQREALAWLALGLAALALSQLHRFFGLTPTWGLLMGCFAALALYGGGWGVQALANRISRLAPWQRPFAYGGGVAVVLLPLSLGLVSLGEPLFSSVALLLLGLGVALVGWRQRVPPLAGVALAIWTLALVTIGPARNPTAWAASGSYLLLGLAWTMGGAALAHRLSAQLPGAAQRIAPATSFPLSIYGATALAGLLASWAGHSSGGQAVVFLGLAALAALIATPERAEVAAWLSLGLALVGAGFGHNALGLSFVWSLAWLVLELVGVSLAGWGATLAGFAPWRRPTTLGATVAGVLLTILISTSAIVGPVPPLTFALASLGLFLVTVAVRERELYYAYVAGAAFVAAALCQLADWGLREPQWYVLPAGLYLLALATGLRRFQGQRRASQVVETAAVTLLLAVTFAQAIREENGLLYSVVLFGEALLVAAYGMLLRLRVPFVGGVVFFVAGVLWMTVDTVRLANQWVLLGIAGLLMVLAYVVLERHQERLVRTGRRWVTQLQSWG